MVGRPLDPLEAATAELTRVTGGSVAAVDDGADLDVSVVLPVYNERGHLRTEIERIQRALTASPYSFEIIVVDDGSNDGSETDLPAIDGIRLMRHSKQPWRRRRPPHRHDGGQGAASSCGPTST